MPVSKIPLGFAVSAALVLWIFNEKKRPNEVTTGDDNNIKLPKRSELPTTLADWRNLFDLDDPHNNKIGAKWSLLDEFFQKKYGVKLWRCISIRCQLPWSWPDDPWLPKPNGFNLLSCVNTDKRISCWPRWCPNSGAQHMARTSSGCDVVVRVITSGGSGENHLAIQRYLNQAPSILLSSNHILPMLEEMVFEDVTFGVFPKVEGNLCHVFSDTFKNSVEDALYAIMQALESGFDEVSQVFADMNKDDPEQRITAAQALDRLDRFVRERPPSSLHKAFPGFT
ncbi:hypothetical protein CVT24_012155 [Panaeolus cyanescens]|uniref:Uncharacterized protein n=1 Tax=Panaeolus cyanescens TaxID=181874 RepID=A0A409YIW7_9AGAR|nr:hypothetical protein CVT24_012155 [Panaeolus cyanescens]